MCRCFGRTILIILNVIVLLLGLLIIAAGVFLVFQLRNLISETDDLSVSIDVDILEIIPYVIIGVGCVVFLIAFSGCCGAITEAKCLLVTYAVCLAVLAAVKIVITVLLFVNLPKITQSVEDTVNEYFLSEDSTKNVTFHLLESQLQCCGTYGPDSYVNDYNLTSPTCCLNNNTSSLEDTIANLPIDNIPANLTTKNQQRQNLPIDLSNLPSNLEGIDLDNLDLGDLGNMTMCKREDSFETGCTTMIAGAVQSYGKSIGFGMIIIICIEIFLLAVTIYLIRTKVPTGGKVLDNQPRYYY